MSTPNPPCFGVSWEEKAIECRGGIDYTQGTGTRPACPVYRECGGVFQGTKEAQQRQADAAARLIPATRLTQPMHSMNNEFRTYQPPAQAGSMQPRPAVAPTLPPTQPRSTEAVLAAVARSQQPPAAPLTFGPGQPMQQRPLQPQGGYMAMDHYIPGYLSAPEPLYDDESIWMPLGRELLRGALKALGHVLANYVDRQIFRRPAPRES